MTQMNQNHFGQRNLFLYQTTNQGNRGDPDETEKK